MEPSWETRRMHRNSTIVSTKQERIATLAKQSPQMAFTSLAYLMDIDWLKEAYRRTRKDGAVGVDGVTAEEYEADLEGNLQRLLDRASPARTRHRPCGGCTSRKAARPPRRARSESPRWRTRSSSGRSSCCWNRSTSRTSWTARTAFGRGDRAPGAGSAPAPPMESDGWWVLEVDIRKFFDALDHRTCGD